MHEKTTQSRKLDHRRGPAVLALGLLIALATLTMTMLAAAQTPPIAVSKTASPNQVPRGSIVLYQVDLQNTGASSVDLNAITDTLPAGFTFVSMGAGSDITQSPDDPNANPIVWTGPFPVAAGATLHLRYNVVANAPASLTPYNNYVQAKLSTGETVFALTGVIVQGPIVTGSKTVNPATAYDRTPVDYTVTLNNEGTLDAILAPIVDTLPAYFRFDQMVSGPLGDPAISGGGNTLTWAGPITVTPGGTLQFTYRVTADGTGGQAYQNSVTATYGDLTAGPFKATVTLLTKKEYAYVPLALRNWNPNPPPPPPVYRLAYESKPGDNYEIYTIEYDGTDLANISNLAGGDMDPDWSPDGTRVAWVHYGGNAEIYVANADGTGAHNASNYTGDDRDPEWSPDGSQILFRSDRDGRWDIFVMNADGSNQRKLTGARSCTSTASRWSPSGAKIGFICGLDKQAELFMMNPDGSNTVRLTDDTDEDRAPDWSPDSTRIVYVRVPDDDDSEIWVVEVSSVTRTRLTTNEVDDFAPIFSPDGTKIVFAHEYSDSEITVMNADGSGMTNLSNSPGGDFLPQWSPDGTLIAFISNRDGNKELYVMRADGSNQFRLTSTSTDESNFDWWPVTP